MPPAGLPGSYRHRELLGREKPPGTPRFVPREVTRPQGRFISAKGSSIQSDPPGTTSHLTAQIELPQARLCSGEGFPLFPSEHLRVPPLP